VARWAAASGALAWAASGCRPDAMMDAARGVLVDQIGLPDAGSCRWRTAGCGWRRRELADSP